MYWLRKPHTNLPNSPGMVCTCVCKCTCVRGCAHPGPAEHRAPPCPPHDLPWESLFHHPALQPGTSLHTNTPYHMLAGPPQCWGLLSSTRSSGSRQGHPCPGNLAKFPAPPALSRDIHQLPMATNTSLTSPDISFLMMCSTS